VCVGGRRAWAPADCSFARVGCQQLRCVAGSAAACEVRLHWVCTHTRVLCTYCTYSCTMYAGRTSVRWMLAGHLRQVTLQHAAPSTWPILCGLCCPTWLLGLPLQRQAGLPSQGALGKESWIAYRWLISAYVQGGPGMSPYMFRSKHVCSTYVLRSGATPCAHLDWSTKAKKQKS